jgi:hypothetical protein
MDLEGLKQHQYPQDLVSPLGYTRWVHAGSGTTLVGLEVVMVALGNKAAGSSTPGNSQAVETQRGEDYGRRDSRVLTTRTNSQTANGVS